MSTGARVLFHAVQEWTWIVMVVTVCIVNGGTAVLVAASDC